ncbi:hypothetical protein CORC01_03086 [Colletotrichum orchidophilum]|uniref:Rhodopsin domain-containing protein n=1 Tax=Colletotrichum orchidophilum TaxID=1209926 RepID=A0A1G4BJV2_9PEZI|nr:uncharacterized protein CORC01_03086 [Colletotrichum orchidophilum]OHF01596.1 hypothetical protein CORC01_03086 [Colletotrichum orchidophilum]
MNSEFANGSELEVVQTGEDVGDKRSLVAVVWAVNLTAFVLVGIIVLVRIIVRCTVTRNFFSDDVLVIIAALFTFAVCALLPIATDLGLGQHYWNLDAEFLPDNTKSLLQLIFIATTLYPCAIAFTRLSAICSFLRITTHQSARWVMYSAAAITGGFGLASIFAVIFQCKPITAAWDSSISGASCYPFIDFLHASAALNIAIDMLLCTMPLLYIWSMKMALSKKLLLTILFAFSGLSCAAVIIKLINLEPLSDSDVTYNWVSWVLCSIAECTIGIVCMSIPPIIPLFAKCSRNKPPAPRKERSKSLRYTLFAEKPTFGRAVAPRVIRPMATPWKDKPLERTVNPDFKPDFHWLRLEQEEAGHCWDKTPQSTKADQVLGIAL